MPERRNDAQETHLGSRDRHYLAPRLRAP